MTGRPLILGRGCNSELRPRRKLNALQRITLTCGRGSRGSIEDSLLPRASTVHNNKSTALIQQPVHDPPVHPAIVSIDSAFANESQMAAMFCDAHRNIGRRSQAFPGGR
jgi:hypothetical protein